MFGWNKYYDLAGMGADNRSDIEGDFSQNPCLSAPSLVSRD